MQPLSSMYQSIGELHTGGAVLYRVCGPQLRMYARVCVCVCACVRACIASVYQHVCFSTCVCCAVSSSASSSTAQEEGDQQTEGGQKKKKKEKEAVTTMSSGTPNAKKVCRDKNTHTHNTQHTHTHFSQEGDTLQEHKQDSFLVPLIPLALLCCTVH